MPTVEKVGEITGKYSDQILYPADVLLVVSPITGINFPVLGLHSLQAACRESGIKARILYGNFPYADCIGKDLHKKIAGDYHLILGERLFAVPAFNNESLSLKGKERTFLSPQWVPGHLFPIKMDNNDGNYPEPIVSYKKWLSGLDLQHLETVTSLWLKEITNKIVRSGCRIIGCSTTLGGLLPAIALLNSIKKADPQITTIIGGALCEEEMAEGICSLKSNIDYIFSGEGEITFPVLVKQILSGKRPSVKIIKGKRITDLDSCPLPDYTDYIQHQDLSHLPKNMKTPTLPFETSRGCWYGKCHFCGLNGKTNWFRFKSPTKIITDLTILTKQHNSISIAMADNMMPNGYFNTLLPQLTGQFPILRIFYQMKANLELPQVIALEKAGIKDFQVGIEALSANLLQRMNKPYSIRSNIAVLRYARTVGVNLEWTLLFGFPGDQLDDYRETLHLLPLIHHLQPPMDLVPLILYRYSKFQQIPEEYNITGLHPAEIFTELFPPYADLEKIAYYFAGTYPSICHEKPEIITELWNEFQNWVQKWEAYRTIPLDSLLPVLHVIKKENNCFILEDTRGITGQTTIREIDREEARFLLTANPLQSIPESFLQWALAPGLGITSGSWFLPLATASPELLMEMERETGTTKIDSLYKEL